MAQDKKKSKVPAWMKGTKAEGGPAWGGLLGGGYNGQDQVMKNLGGNTRANFNGQMVSMTPGMILRKTQPVNPVQELLRRLRYGEPQNKPGGAGAVRG